MNALKYSNDNSLTIKLSKEFIAYFEVNATPKPHNTSFTINISSILATVPIVTETEAANDNIIQQSLGGYVVQLPIGKRTLYGNIPEELKKLKQWQFTMPSDDPKEAKRPYTVVNGKPIKSGVTHKWAYLTFEVAVEMALKYGGNIGFCLTEEDDYICIDSDTEKAGVPTDHAKVKLHHEIYEAFTVGTQTYSELSISGKNTHIWIKAKLDSTLKPKFKNKDGIIVGDIDILVKDAWVICTGNTLNTGNFIAEDNATIVKLLSHAINNRQQNNPMALDEVEAVESDEAIKAKLLVNDFHKQLWEHIPTPKWMHQSFPSQSEADLTLVIALAKLTSSNSQVIRLFRESGLGKRDKAYREDYVNKTIANARGIIAKEAEEYAGLDRFIENLFANANADADVDVDSIAGTANSTDKKSDADIDSTAETADSTVKESDVGLDSTADNTSSTESVDSNKFKTAYSTVDLLKHIDDEQLIKRMTLTLARGIQLPLSSSFLMGLAIFSSITTRVYRVTYRYGGLLPIGIYALAEQPPATAKTWLQSEFKRPFEKFDDGRRKAHVEEIKQLQDWLDANRKHKEFNENKEKLIELKKKPIPVLFVTNATAEALEVSLTKTGGYFSLVSSEQTMVESVLGKLYGNELRANNNEVTLNGFDGGKSGTLRVGRETYSGRAIGGVALFAQNGSIETVLNASNGTGLSDRFLMLCEAHLLGTRDYINVPPIDRSITAEYDKLCTSIAQLALKDEKEEIRILTFSEYGYLRINEYKNYIEPDLADDAKYACHNSLRGGAGKADMKIMKIAANLHLLDGGMDQSVIADKHVIAAIKILDDLINAALGLCHDKGIVGVKAESEAIIDYLSKRTKLTKMCEIYNSLRSTQPFTDMTGSKADAITKAVNDMVERGELTFNPPVSKGSGTYSIT